MIAHVVARRAIRSAACCLRVLFLGIVLLPGLCAAAIKNWIGPPGGDFATPAHWSTTAGSACGANPIAAAPGAAGIATFVSDTASATPRWLAQ